MMLNLVIVTALAFYAGGVLQSPGMALHDLRKWLDRCAIPSFLRKPLYECPPCMSSIWGSVVWFFLSDEFFTINWPLFCLAVCGVSYILIYNFPYDE